MTFTCHEPAYPLCAQRAGEGDAAPPSNPRPPAAAGCRAWLSFVLIADTCIAPLPSHPTPPPYSSLVDAVRAGPDAAVRS